MKRLFVSLPLVFFGLSAGAVHAQESAKVQITIKISDKEASFTNQRLVVTLVHDFPLDQDRGPRTVASHVDAQFSHRKGKETVLKITLGDNVKMDPDVQYFVNLSVFTPDSKRTHHGEIDGDNGPFRVITNDSPRALTLSVAADRED